MHPSAEGHLACVCVLAVVNSAAGNPGVHAVFSAGACPGAGLLERTGALFSVFKGPPCCCA